VKRWLEVAGTLVFTTLMVVLGARVVGLIDGPAALAVVVAASAAAVLVTDFISALVHWFCDTYFEEDTPLLGPALIFPFREHHRDPMAMTHRRALEINNSNALSVIPFLAAGVAADAPHSLFAQSWLVAFGAAVYATNTIHKWAHQRRAPAPVRWLQRAGLLLRPAHHRRHHARPTAAYGITTGWLNPLLDRTRFFRGLEALIALAHPAGGRTPRSAGRA